MVFGQLSEPTGYRIVQGLPGMHSCHQEDFWAFQSSHRHLIRAVELSRHFRVKVGRFGHAYKQDRQLYTEGSQRSP